MEIQVINRKTEEVEFVALAWFEVEDFFEYEQLDRTDYWTREVHSCRGCSESKDDVQERHDYHGITTGYYCEDCYENNYPYRKDDYTHGTGICDDGTPLDW